jgi:hypothetical protein
MGTAEVIRAGGIVLVAVCRSPERALRVGEFVRKHRAIQCFKAISASPIFSLCLLLALFANSLRCNGASATEGRPAVTGVTA